jgi:hypothetical protein
MTGKPRLPRMADVTYTDAQGRTRKRYAVRREGSGWNYSVWDRTVLIPTDRIAKILALAKAEVEAFRTSDAAKNWLKKTTVRSYQLVMLNKTMDRRGA